MPGRPLFPVFADGMRKCQAEATAGAGAAGPHEAKSGVAGSWY